MKQSILYLLAVFSNLNLQAQEHAIRVSTSDTEDTIWNMPWIWCAIAVMLILVLIIIGAIINRKDF